MRKNFLFWTVLGIVYISSLTLISYANDSFDKEVTLLISPSKASYAPPVHISEKRAWIEIDFGNGKKRMFESALGEENYSLETALASAARAGNFSFSAENGRINHIAHIDNPGAWRVYRNGNITQSSIKNLTITGGDRYTFKHEE